MTTDSSASTSPSEFSSENASPSHSRIRLMVSMVIAWKVIELIVALWSGRSASSTVLVNFGLHSFIELLSAAVIVWQFSTPRPEQREKTALRVIAIAFICLAAFIAMDAISTMFGINKPTHSPVGIALAILSLVALLLLNQMTRRSAEDRGSTHALVGAGIAVALLAGLLLNWFFGWAWADPIAALVIAVCALFTGYKAWKGDAHWAQPASVLASKKSTVREG